MGIPCGEPLVFDMGTQPFSHRKEMRGRRRTDQRTSHGSHALDESATIASYKAAMLRQMQDQMLVNQALMEKIVVLEQAKAALHASQQNLHDLLAHQQVAREVERKRISRELYDTLGQNLLALRIDIVMMHQKTTSRHYRLRERIGAALDNVDATLRSIKQLVGEIRPSCLELGLMATLDMELRKFTRASGIACELAGEPGIDALVMDEEALLTLYRALQECLNNVLRHSLASRVNVRLHIVHGMLAMGIVDNGIGFDPASPRKPGSFGLLDLHERVGSHGGSLVIRSAHAQGTEVGVTLPLTTGNRIHAEPA
jgi:signal transduction histidine kinase